MKRITIVLCLLCVLIASAGAAGTKDRQQIPLQDGSTITVSSDIPAVVLSEDPSGSSMTVSLRGTNDRHYRLLTNHSGRNVTVEVKRIKRFNTSLFGSHRPELHITIPARVNLDALTVNTVSGSISINHPIRARLIEVTTVSGSLNFTSLQAADSVRIRSVSGKISGQLISGATVTCENVSGKLAIDHINATSGAIELISVSGSLDVTTAGAPRAIFRTVSGSIKTTLPPSFSGTVETSNISGPVQTEISSIQYSEADKRKRIYRIGTTDELYQFSSTSGRIQITQ